MSSPSPGTKIQRIEGDEDKAGVEWGPEFKLRIISHQGNTSEGKRSVTSLPHTKIDRLIIIIVKGCKIVKLVVGNNR